MTSKGPHGPYMKQKTMTNTKVTTRLMGTWALQNVWVHKAVVVTSILRLGSCALQNDWVVLQKKS